MRLITGGRIFTADPEQPWAGALVINGDRIAYVGTHEAAAAVAGPDAVVTDISGHLALPGFVDAHAHLLMTGDSLGRAQLRDAPDLAEIQARVAAWALAHPEAPRVLGVSWQFSAVPGGAPTKEMLDAIVSDRPVYLDANDLHSTWVNSRALEELGIAADTPDPIGGAIARDPATGEATGHLIETAASGIAWPMLARVDDAERDRQLATALEAYRTSGTTTAVDMALNAPALAAMARAEAAGTLDVRIVGHWHIARHEDPAEELAQVARAAELAHT